MRWRPLPPVRRRRAGRRPKRRMAPCRNGIQTVAAWISKIPRNHEPMPGWAGTGAGRPGRGRHIRLKARQHMHGMQCHVCRKRWGGSIRGYLIRRGATPLKGELAPFAQRLTTGVMKIQKAFQKPENLVRNNYFKCLSALSVFGRGARNLAERRKKKRTPKNPPFMFMCRTSVFFEEKAG